MLAGLISVRGDLMVVVVGSLSACFCIPAASKFSGGVGHSDGKLGSTTLKLGLDSSSESCKLCLAARFLSTRFPRLKGAVTASTL